jgi:hypothetical protein
MEILKLSYLWFAQIVLRKIHGEQWLRGPNERSPVVSLGLISGDVARIKSRKEIEATLDYQHTNRGLGICYEMTRLCEGDAEVERRVDRIINEVTGVMREIQNTVTLRNVRAPGKRATLNDLGCLCANEIGDCPRGETMYWREIWLERVDAGGA